MKSNVCQNKINRLPTTALNQDNNMKKFPVNNLDINDYMIFSYKYFRCKSLKNSYFNNCFFSQYDYAEWITFCLSRIANLSTMSISEIKGAGKSTRFHIVKGGPLKKLKSVLKEIGLDVVIPKGAFYVFPSIKKFGLSSEEFANRLLREQKLAVVPGTAFGNSGEGFVRISYAYSIENLKEGIKRIKNFIEKL